MDMVENELDFGHGCLGIFRMLESRFGSGDLISIQISRAHRTYGRIPSPEHGWEGIFLKTNLHIRAISSMIDLSKVEGETGRMYDHEYLRVISAILPPQLVLKKSILPTDI